MAEKSICVVIPAKAISKRIPGKNLKDLAGKPMLAYILETAKSAKGIDRVVVTTESDAIKEVAQAYGAEVLHRPVELTEDTVTSHQVLLHAMTEFANSGYFPDYILLLYPTSPLLKRERIEEAVQLALRNDSDSVISGTYDKGHYWKKGIKNWKRLYPIDLLNSQMQEPLFKENGAIYLSKTSILKDRLVAEGADILLMDPHENIDVDYPEDFEAVEKLLRGI